MLTDFRLYTQNTYLHQHWMYNAFFALSSSLSLSLRVFIYHSVLASNFKLPTQCRWIHIFPKYVFKSHCVLKMRRGSCARPRSQFSIVNWQLDSLFFRLMIISMEFKWTTMAFILFALSYRSEKLQSHFCDLSGRTWNFCF